MSKIRPINPVGEDNFDGIDDAHNVDYHLYRGGQSKRRTKKKRTLRSPDNDRQQEDAVLVVKELLWGKRSLHIGAPFTYLGFMVSMLVQLHPLSQKYNLVIVGALSVAVEFKFFPAQSVRAQLIIALSVLFSNAVDIFQIVMGHYSGAVIAAITIVMVFKLGLLGAFLRNSQSAVRTRKYLYRRFRLFIIPFYQPKRIMRDVRARIAAIWWMELVAFLCYGVLFLLYFVLLDFSSIYLGVEASSAIPTFLLFKAASTLLVTGMIYLDIDVRLCLWYFGCMACCVDYVRKYITRERIERKGFPLIFAFSKYRFQVLQFLKFVDFLWGLYGWAILSKTFGTRFYSIGLKLQVFCGTLAFCLVVFDVWVVTLFMGLRWLLKRDKLMREISRDEGKEVVSDDSEIEEFGLRLSLEQRLERDEDKAALAEERRKLYFRRMKEEEIRLAARTAERDGRGRAGLAGAADWLQETLQWSAPSRASALVAPQGGETGQTEPLTRAPRGRDGWDLEGAEEHDVTYNHSSMVASQYQARSGGRNGDSAARGSNKINALLQALQNEEVPSKSRDDALLSNRIMPKPTEPAFNRQNPKKGVAWALFLNRGGGSGGKQRVLPHDEATQEEGREQEEGDVVSPMSCAQGLGSSAAPRAPQAISVSRQQLDGTFSLSPEEFGSIWSMLADYQSSSVSTVRVPPSLLNSAKVKLPPTFPTVAAGGGSVAEMQLFAQRQQLLAVLVKHLRARGVGISSAGLHERRDIQILGSARAVGRDDAQFIGLLEVKLFPGTVAGVGEQVQQASYLLECACRCRDDRQRQLYLAELGLQAVLNFVD